VSASWGWGGRMHALYIRKRSYTTENKKKLKVSYMHKNKVLSF
jgi:hypothetical protein